MLDTRDRINALQYVKQLMLKRGEGLSAAVKATYFANRWFTEDQCHHAINGIAKDMLEEQALEQWISAYNFDDKQVPQKIGLVLAGNIPLVGFHDWLSVFISGHQAVIKTSGKDAKLLPYLVSELVMAFPQFKDQTTFVEKLTDIDAVIATGSNNSARYFEQYFGKYPNIIRKNRNGIAVLDGEESTEDLLRLGEDIFRYFGLGCRSTSKIFVPKGYDFPKLMEALHSFNSVVLNNKYKNNFDYQRTLYLLNNVDHFINGSIICLEGTSYASSVATLHYEYYDSLEGLSKKLLEEADQIQCISAKFEIPKLAVIPLGQAQRPSLMDYADGVDTLAFLKSL